jgi:hypothetical protein
LTDFKLKSTSAKKEVKKKNEKAEKRIEERND